MSADLKGKIGRKIESLKKVKNGKTEYGMVQS
jgi:hypothetical protein